MYNINVNHLLNRFDAEIDKRAADPEPMFWFLTEEGDDTDENYCYDCIMALKQDALIGEHFIGYGSVWSEQDGCEHCERCGVLLRYTLTNYGLYSELEHYSENPFDWSDSNDCAHVAPMIGGAFTQSYKRAVVMILLHGLNYPETIKRRTAQWTTARLTTLGVGCLERPIDQCKRANSQ